MVRVGSGRVRSDRFGSGRIGSGRALFIFLIILIICGLKNPIKFDKFKNLKSELKY